MQEPRALARMRWPLLVFLAGAAAILLPTMYDVARLTWTTEQGGHAPIIVATGAWLFYREFRATNAKIRPPRPWLGALALGGFLVAYVVSRITGVLEVEGLAMYGAILSAFY